MTDNNVLPFPEQASHPLKEKKQVPQKKIRLNFWKKWVQRRQKKKKMQRLL